MCSANTNCNAHTKWNFLKTEDWPNLRNLKTEDLKMQFSRFEDLKTALFCHFSPHVSYA